MESTPTFFIGDRRHAGPYDARTLADLLLAATPDPATPDPAAPAGALPALGTLRGDGRRGEQVPDTDLPDDLQETPDRDGAFPQLRPDQLALLQRHGRRRPVARGDVLYREGDPGYDFFAVLSGLVAIVEDVDRSSRRMITVSGPGRFLGELNLFGEQPVYLSAVVAEAGEVLDLGPAQLRTAFAESPELRDLVLRAFLLRRSRLLTVAADLLIIGEASDDTTTALRAWATDNAITHTFTDLDHDAEALDLLTELGLTAADAPVAIWRDDTVLRNPTVAQLATVARPAGSTPPEQTGPTTDPA